MPKIVDITGKTFGKLTVLEYVGLNKDKKSLWKCQCSCEKKTIKIYMAHSLKIGNAKGCGCIKKPSYNECIENMKKKLERNSKWNKECLEWQGYISNEGYHYGMVYFPVIKKYCAVHRISYWIWKEKIPDGMCVLHSCDNKKCINPNHLHIGTKSQNSLEMSERKRHPYLLKNKKSNHHKAKLTENDIIKIKEMRKQGMTLKMIAEQFNVHLSSISLICKDRIWKTV